MEYIVNSFDNKSVNNAKRFLGIDIINIKLFILAFLVSSMLMGADSSYTGSRLVYDKEHINQLKLSASAMVAMEKGQWPIRIAEGISEDTGQPIHQFYSPGAHSFIAVLSILTRDLFFGYLLAMILMSTLAFIYSFKLVKYLTRSDLVAIVGAFIFVSGPYLATDRVLRAAIPEYMAICLLPMVLYYQLISLVKGKCEYICKAVLSTSWLFLIHLITSVFFYFFYGLFLFVLFFYNIILLNKKRKLFIYKFYRRIKIVFIIGFLVALLDMYYLIPIVFYNDLQIKMSTITRYSMYYSAHLVPLITIISIRDIIFPTSRLDMSIRIQIGLVLFSSYIAFIYYKIKEYKSSYAVPLIISASLIVYIIINPIMFVGPLRILDFAQFSYRFLAHFQLVAMIMGCLALTTFWRQNKDYLSAQKKNLSVMLIICSLILVCPYLYPATFSPELPKFINEEDIKDVNGLAIANNNYIRIPPVLASQIIKLSPFTSREVVSANLVKNTSDRIFEIDLSDKTSVRGKPGERLLDVLYYPLLMDIEVSIDGQPITPGLETYWRTRAGFGYFLDDDDGYFHGLKITGLPNTGKLHVRVKFVGNKIGNWISLITLVGILYCYYFRKFYIKKNRNFNKCNNL
jgi:hypothetical protein